MQLPREQVDQIKRWQRGMRRFAFYYQGSPLVTLGLLTAFLFLHVATGWADHLLGNVDRWGVVFGARSSEVLTAFGGRARDRVFDGEIWRLLTSGFLHGDASHVFFNGIAFWGLGRMSEAVFGRARMLLLFLIAVIGGSLLGQVGSAPLSIGASGGVFGLMGALVAFGLRHGRELSPPMREEFGRRLWPWILMNLVIGAMLPMVDQYAHVGGLVTGAVCGALMANRVTDHGEGSSLAGATVTVAGAALLSVVGAGIVLSLRG